MPSTSGPARGADPFTGWYLACPLSVVVYICVCVGLWAVVIMDLITEVKHLLHMLRTLIIVLHLGGSSYRPAESTSAEVNFCTCRVNFLLLKHCIPTCIHCVLVWESICVE